MRKKRRAAGRAIEWRVAALALALWLGAMGILTWAVAADLRMQIEHQTREFADSMEYRGQDAAELPGTVERNLIQRLGYPYYMIGIERLLPVVLPQFSDNGYGSEDWLWGKWDLLYGFEAAVLFEGAPATIGTGNYLSVAYTDEDRWKAGDREPLGYAYVSLDEIPDEDNGLLAFCSGLPTGEIGISLFVPLLRLTGYFDGNQWIPATIERENGERLVTAQLPGERDVQTIYGWDPVLVSHQKKPVRWQDTTYESLSALLNHAVQTRNLQGSRSLLETVALAASDHEDGFGSYTCFAAVRCRPLRYAVLHLLPLYIGTLLLTLLGVYLLLRRISRNLTEHLTYLSSAIERGSTIAPSSPWAEVYDVEAYFARTRQELGEANANLQQMQTALDYARDAEQNRRQLVSNLTHQMKTPLAVIHSYAEGLQAHIREEKREQYLRVILEETEKMDTMVLQMLDLSRLEAGKVHLSVSCFSLPQLVKAVEARFRPLLSRKQLEVSDETAADFLITADEGRMEQVLSNFLSNAIQYTEPGGKITMRCYAAHNQVHFTIENPCAPLDAEALQKIWDTFYRGSTAGKAPGTGLGLPIAKSIVELHGGTCTVRNTETGVEFGFVI